MTWKSQWVVVTASLFVPYAVLVARLSRAHCASTRWSRPGDVSYGVYVYAFPVQQTVVAGVGGGRRRIGMLVLAAPITYLLASPRGGSSSRARSPSSGRVAGALAAAACASAA